MDSFKKMEKEMKKDNKRKDVEKAIQARRTYLTEKRRKFFLRIVSVVLLYPLVPAFTYFLLLWTWGNQMLEPDLFNRRENLAVVAHSITGGFESPIQLTLTIWLMLKGISNNDFSFGNLFIDFKLPTDTFGNVIPLPTISIWSSVLSIISICMACIRLNIPVPYRYFAHSLTKMRSSQIVGHLPFFLASIIFRVMSYAYIWLFLHLWTFVPLLSSLFFNAYVGYKYDEQLREQHGKKRGLSRKIRKHLQKKRKIKEEFIQLKIDMLENTKDKDARRDSLKCELDHARKTRRNEEEEEKLKKPVYEQMSIAIWLSSFVGIWIPCCYSRPIADTTLQEIHANEWQEIEEMLNEKKHAKLLDLIEEKPSLEIQENKEILMELDSTRQQFSRKVMKLQEIFNTLLHLVCIIIIFILVNFYEKFKYQDNKLTNFSFNVFSVVVATYGVLTFLLTLLDFDIFEKMFSTTKVISESEDDLSTNGQTCLPAWAHLVSKLILSLLLCVAVMLPIFAGGFYNHKLSPSNGFAILISERVVGTESLSLSMVKIYPVNEMKNETESFVGKIYDCGTYLNAENDGRPIVLVANLSDESCLKFIKKEKFTETMQKRRHINDIIILWESWEHRSSSPFPTLLHNMDITHLQTHKDHAILSVNNKDNFGSMQIENAEENKMRIVLPQKQRPQGFPYFLPNTHRPLTMQKLLEDELFVVECDVKTCVDVQTQAQEVKKPAGNKIFLCRGDSEPKTNVNVTFSCRDRGNKCLEFERFMKARRGDSGSDCSSEIVLSDLEPKVVSMRCRSDKSSSWQKREDQLVCSLENTVTFSCCPDNHTKYRYTVGCQTAKAVRVRETCDRLGGWGRWSGQEEGTEHRQVGTATLEALGFTLFRYCLLIHARIKQGRITPVSATSTYLKHIAGFSVLLV